MEFDDKYFMRLALQEAKQAFDNDEVPVGAVVMLDNRVIGRGHNQTEQLQDATAHAEMIAITSAMQKLGSKYLSGAVLYVTLEPCLMCAGATFWSKIRKIVYGASDEKFGFMRIERLANAGRKTMLTFDTEIVGGVLEQEAAELLKDFFRRKRK